MLKSILALLAIPFLLIVVGQLGGFKGKTPADLGVKNGKLKPPSGKPNSVSSQANFWPNTAYAEHAMIEPLQFKGDDMLAMQQLNNLIAQMPRTQIITQKPDYIYAQQRSQWLGFVDDLEFWLDPLERVIHVRSSSRLGHKDFGVNRNRIEALRLKNIRNR